MRIALIADAYPPMRSSAAVQLRDLSRELLAQGHDVTVIVPATSLAGGWSLETVLGVDVLRLSALPTKDIALWRRVLGELLMPYCMWRNLKRSAVADARWDGVVWYSPSIFFGPLIHSLKQKSSCRSYLILRDIFPEWAVDMGLLRRGLRYRFFKHFERQQYAEADVIGVQTAANLPYLQSASRTAPRQLEVLQNWLAPAEAGYCSIHVDDTSLRGRKILVYAGNMGIAQGMSVLLDVAERLLHRQDIGFLFVGRGSDALLLREQARCRGLDNTLFCDEIEPDEIPGLYSQCHVGIVSLDPRHRTHNVPGKFLSYMQSGLPVLACINPGNDLIDMIRQHEVGLACTDRNVAMLSASAELLVDRIATDPSVRERCQQLSKQVFSPEVTVRQIVAALNR